MTPASHGRTSGRVLHSTPSPLAALALAAAIAAGCAGTPRPNAAAALESSRRSVEEVAADATVQRHAAAESALAQAELKRAEAAWSSRDIREAEHLTYLAGRRAEVARQLAQSRAADDAARLATAERDKLVAEARQRQAQRQAQAAQVQAQTAQAQTEQVRDRAAALQRQLEQLAAQRTARGMVLTLPDVLFTSGSATLQPGGERTVSRIAQVMREFPQQRIRIEGHTDSVGDDTANQRLSQQRAEAFAIALIQAGADANRVQAAGLGEAAPVASNDSPEGRQRNRRVEIVFSDADGRLGLLR